MAEHNDENNISFLIKTGVQRFIMGNILDIAKSLFSDDPKKLGQFVRLVKKTSYNGITIMNDALNTFDLSKASVVKTDELLPRVDGAAFNINKDANK